MTHLHGHYVGLVKGLRLGRFSVISTIIGWSFNIPKKMVLQIPTEGFF
jgi:hypothetical protein